MAEIRQDIKFGFRVGFAGDTFNTVVYCARSLGPDSRIGYCTRIGLDPLSRAFLLIARKEGIDVSQVFIDPERKIGIYTVATDKSGERQFDYWRSHSAARMLFSDDDSPISLPSARIVYLSAISLAILHPEARSRMIGFLRNLRERNECHIAFDSNFRPQLWENRETACRVVSEMWEIADIALPSIDDEMALFQESSEEVIVERFGKHCFHACAIKRGSRGPVSPNLARDAHPDFIPAVNVVDTTAAGDSFNGAYLAALIRGKSEEQCLLSAHQTASNVVGVDGAIISN